MNSPHLTQENAQQSIDSLANNGNLAELIIENCTKYRDRCAFQCGTEEISYGAIDLYSQKLAGYLVEECLLSRGDRVAVMMPNTLAYPISALAILRAGLVLVNVNPQYTANELKHQLVDSGAKAIIAISPAIEIIDKILNDTFVDSIIEVPLNAPIKPGPQPHGGTNIAFNSAISAYPLEEAVSIDTQTVAVLQYTGGTTGPSKGATLTHGNITANQQQITDWVGPKLRELPNTQQHVVVTALPLYHIFAFGFNCLAMMCFGAKNILVTNPREIDKLAEIFINNKVTVFSGVNTLFNGLLHTPGFEKGDFQSMKLVVGGGSAIQKAVAEKWQALTGCNISQGYGLSETSPVLTMSDPSMANFDDSVGLPMSHTEIVLLDDNDNVVGSGERGELCVRGPQVMSGYWQRQDANAEAFTSDGYFRTGDIAVCRSDLGGAYQIVDRKKDMILVSGFNVYPNEIEAICAKHPAVLEAACIGVPDEKTGECVKIFVVKTTEELTEDDLIRHCREHLTAYKIPRHIEFLNELPKSPVGKVLRRELR